MAAVATATVAPAARHRPREGAFPADDTRFLTLTRHAAYGSSEQQERGRPHGLRCSPAAAPPPPPPLPPPPSPPPPPPPPWGVEWVNVGRRVWWGQAVGARQASLGGRFGAVGDSGGAKLNLRCESQTDRPSLLRFFAFPTRSVPTDRPAARSAAEQKWAFLGRNTPTDGGPSFAQEARRELLY